MTTRLKSTEEALSSLQEATTQLQNVTAGHDATLVELLQSSAATRGAVTSVHSSLHEILIQLARLQKSPDRPGSPHPPPYSPSPPSPTLHHSLIPQPQPLHLKLSHFDGSDPLDWILQSERYFTLHSTADEHHIDISFFFMTGEALSWFNWMSRNHQFTTWPAFTHALELRFGPSSFVYHEATLFKLTQTSSVAAYQSAIEAISNRVDGLSDQSLLNCFLSGLKPAILRDLQILKPSSTSHAIGLAKLIKDKFLEQHPLPRPPPRPPLLPLPTPHLLKSPLLPSPSLKPSPYSPFPDRRLSPSELQHRRTLDLCFNCDEKFSPQHKCKASQFLLLGDTCPTDYPLLEDSLGIAPVSPTSPQITLLPDPNSGPTQSPIFSTSPSMLSPDVLPHPPSASLPNSIIPKCPPSSIVVTPTISFTL